MMPDRAFASEAGFRVADIKVRSTGVAARYANALFELALETGSLDAVEADLGRFSGLLNDSEDLRRLVTSPVFSADDQFRAIGAVLDRADIVGLVGNVIRIAAQNRRLSAMPGIAVAFGDLLARHRGEVTAEVTSAEPLTDARVADLKGALKDSLGKDVTLAARVDPSLIGGLTLKVGSRMIDGSLRSKLNSLKLAMKEVG